MCGIHVASAQASPSSAVLAPGASLKPLVTPTPFPTIPVITLPKLSEQETATTSAMLSSFLKYEGFGVVKLKQKDLDNDPKRLVVDVEINRVGGLLEVDTGAGGTVVARRSLKRFRLFEHRTLFGVPTFGKQFAPGKFWGLAKLDTLAMGNSVMYAVPVAVKEVPQLDGLLGTPELHRVGAVLDSVGSALYLAPGGPSRRTSDKLAVMLQRNGFTQVPLRLNSDHHLEVGCSIDGVPSTILVDTGSQFTFVDQSIGTRAGIMMKQSITADGAPLGIGRAKKFAIGDFEIRDADICFVDLKKADHPSTYLLGISELASNFAIIDIGGLSMYLRHPQ